MPKPHTVGTAIAGTLTILSGIALLIASSISTSQISFIRDGWDELYSLSIYSIIIGGLIVVLTIGFLFVIIRNFPALTALFSVLILIVFILAIVCAIMLAVVLGNMKDDSHTYINNLMRNYSESKTVVSSKELVGTIQQTLRCCGLVQASDWAEIYSDHKSTPDSCCHVLIPGCGNQSLVLNNTIYLRGCADGVSSYLYSDVVAMIILNTIVAALIPISAIFGFIAERYIRRHYEQM